MHWRTRPGELDAARDVPERFHDLFWSRVTEGDADACWPWSGAFAVNGYGVYTVRFGPSETRQWKSHRLAWSFLNGVVPDGMVVRHTCDNPPCCNPAHLLIGTPADNSRDMAKRGRAPQGPRRGHCAGEANGHAKVSNEQRRAIVRAYRAGEGNQSQIADRFGLTQATVSKIVRSGFWAA